MKYPATAASARNTINTIMPMTSPNLPLLFGAGATSGITAFGSRATVTLDLETACSTTVEAEPALSTKVGADMLGLIGVLADADPGCGADVAGAVSGTEVTDASNPITVGAFTSEFV